MIKQIPDSVFLRPLVIFASIVIIIAGVKVSSDVLAPIFLAFIVTLLLAPFIFKLQRVGVPRWLAILLISFGAVLLLGIILGIIYSSLNQLIEKLPLYQKELLGQVTPFLSFLQKRGVNTVKLIPEEWLNGSAIVRSTFDILTQVVSNTTSVIFFLFTLLLMLISSESFVKKFEHRYKKANPLMQSFSEWSRGIQHQFRIQSTSNFLSALLVTAGFFFLRIDFALFWGILAFILAYIPNIGIIIASIPPVLLAFIQYGPQTAFLTAGLIIFLNIIMDNFVTPRLMGEGLKVPPVIIFISFIFWSWVFGILGAFFALPITLALRSIFSSNPDTKFLADLLTAEKEKATHK